MTINRNPKNNTELFVKNNGYASNFFGGDQTLNLPKTKDSFVCGIIPNADAMGADRASKFSYPNNIFLLQSVTGPKITFDVEILNQYNRKRVVTSSHKYSPVSLVFHDDQDNKVFTIFTDYLRYYFPDTLNVDKKNWLSDTVSRLNDTNGFGYSINSHKQYFTAIWLAWVSGGNITYVVFHNPVLSNLDFSDLNYDDGGFSTITTEFTFEGMSIDYVNLPINSNNPDTLKGGADLVKYLLKNAEDIGKPGEGPNIGVFDNLGIDRTPGLGELFNTAATFFGKYDGKPTLKNALDEFILEPSKRKLVGTLASWGNFNFGGLPKSVNKSGLFDGLSEPLGGIYKDLSRGTSPVIKNFSLNPSNIVEDIDSGLGQISNNIENTFNVSGEFFTKTTKLLSNEKTNPFFSLKSGLKGLF